MPRKSSVDTNLSEEVREVILRKQGDGYSLDQLMAWLEEIGEEDAVSRSALGRWTMTQESVATQLKNTRIMASALGRELSEAEDDSQTGRIAIEMLQSIAMKMTAASLSGRAADLSPQEVAYMSKSLKDTMSALEIDDRRVAKIKDEERKRVLAEVDSAVETVKKSGGLSADAAKTFYQELLKIDH